MRIKNGKKKKTLRVGYDISWLSENLNVLRREKNAAKNVEEMIDQMILFRRHWDASKEGQLKMSDLEMRITKNRWLCFLFGLLRSETTGRVTKLLKVFPYSSLLLMPSSLSFLFSLVFHFYWFPFSFSIHALYERQNSTIFSFDFFSLHNKVTKIM